MPVILAERTEDICEKKSKGTATTSLRAGETHSDEITERDQKKISALPNLRKLKTFKNQEQTSIL